MTAAIRFAAFFALAIAAPSSTQAEDASSSEPLCLNPQQSYEARVISSNDVVARNTLGRTPGSELRLTTSCAGLDAIDRVSLSSAFSCIGKGDALVATAANGRRKNCVVTAIEPYARADADGTDE